MRQTRVGSSTFCWARTTRNACCASHSAAPVVRRREHRRLVGRKPAPQLVEVRLDAAELGREVVGDEQRRHRSGGYDARTATEPPEDASPNRHVTPATANAPRYPVSSATTPAMTAPKPDERSKNDENVPTTDARSVSVMPVEREQQQRGIHERHPAREDDRADDEPGRRSAHAAMTSMPMPAPTQRERARVRARRGCRGCARRGCARRGSARRRAGRSHPAETSTSVSTYSGMSGANADSGISPRNSTKPGRSAAGCHNGPRRGSCRRARHLAREEPERRRDERERGRHDERELVAIVAAQEVAERGPEREAAVHRDRPVAHRLAPPVARARGR